MIKKTYYEKIGRRYVPVHEYDEYHMDALPYGNHMIMVYPGGQTTSYDVAPALAPMIAAGRIAENRMCDEIRRASEMRPKQTPITEGQRRAWNRLAKEFGDDLATLNCPSARDIAIAGREAMQAEAEKLMTNPSVKLAYEQFLLVCELTKKQVDNA
jgi:hypothetical protein